MNGVPRAREIARFVLFGASISFIDENAAAGRTASQTS
jgi:hypothetical protein